MRFLNYRSAGLATLAAAFALSLAGMAQAEGNWTIEPKFGVEVTQLDNIDEGMQAGLAFGYDGGPWRVAGEYAWGNHAPDEVSIMGFGDYDIAAFTLSAGGGFYTLVEDVRNFEFGGAGWKVAAAGAWWAFDTSALTLEITYQREFDDSEHDRTEIVAGWRKKF